MAAISAYQAKTHFSRLLQRASRGERITITRHGVPVAQLGPLPSDRKRRSIHDAIEKLIEFGKRHPLRGMTVRQMIEEGRRF